MASPFAAQILPNRAVIRLAGEAPLAFPAQPADLRPAAPAGAHWAYGALLSPQGKIQHDVFVIHDGGTVYRGLRGFAAGRRLLQKLKLYRLRARIEIAPDDGHAVAVATSDGLAATDPRLPGMGLRAIVQAGSLAAGTGYDTARIALGLADSDADIGENLLFPHEANLDQLGGVSFTKGCYVGQEVVSRMEHRGTARSRILPVNGDRALPRPRARRSAPATSSSATMLSSSGRHGLALIRLDRLAEAAHRC
jgi:folate-binding protein YgfZ